MTASEDAATVAAATLRNLFIETSVGSEPMSPL
jgi:hypothetical protein